MPACSGEVIGATTSPLKDDKQVATLAPPPASNE